MAKDSEGISDIEKGLTMMVDLPNVFSVSEVSIANAGKFIFYSPMERLDTFRGITVDGL